MSTTNIKYLERLNGLMSSEKPMFMMLTYHVLEVANAENNPAYDPDGSQRRGLNALLAVVAIQAEESNIKTRLIEDQSNSEELVFEVEFSDAYGWIHVTGSLLFGYKIWATPSLRDADVAEYVCEVFHGILSGMVPC